MKDRHREWQKLRDEGYSCTDISMLTGYHRQVIGQRTTSPKNLKELRKKLRIKGLLPVKAKVEKPKPKSLDKLSNQEDLGKGVAKLNSTDKVFKNRDQRPERPVRIDQKTTVFVKIDDKRTNEQIIEYYQRRMA